MVMRALDRKLLRDLLHMKVQAAAIALVVASGVSLFVATLTTYRSMRLSQDHYYTRWRFAEVWSDLSRAPLSLTRKLADIPGVAAVEGRVKYNAIVDVPGLAEPASAVLLSIPRAAGHTLNDLHLRRGRHVEPGREGEVLVSEAFADRNRLSLGDTMIAVVAGRRVQLRMVGVALSPEYVMPIPPSGLAPDDRRFAVLWMARDELQSLVDLRGAMNELAVALAQGANERSVVAAIDRALEPYGGRGAYGRDSQPSHTMLEEHVQPLKPLALVIPTIFLLVAAFLVNMVLSRFVATQREQIGLLKAFGYSAVRVAVHYLELTLLIVLAGVAIGLPVGAWLGKGLAAFYADFFRFPVLVFRIEPAVVGTAGLVAVLTAGMGALGSVRRVLALPPVVAMAPEVPAFRRTLLDQMGLSRWLSPAFRMVVRNVLRRPLRSALAVAGMSLAVAVVLVGSSSADGTDRMRDVRYQAAERQDVTVSLTEVRSVGSVRDFRALPAVTRAEPYRIVPARLLGPGRAQDLVLMGLPSGGVLRGAVDNWFRRVPVPDRGIVLTAWLAREFSLRRGDPVAFEVRERRRRMVVTHLAATVEEPLGVAGYMELGALGRLLGEPATFSGANLTVDPLRARDLYAKLKQMPAAGAVEFRRGALASYRAMSDSAVTFMRRIEVLFAVIIAFGVVYNTAKIALAERARELATLRVLGFTRGEVSRILLGELAVLAIPAIPIGLYAGHWLSSLVISTWTTLRMHPPLLISSSTYAFAVLVFALGAAASALVVRRGLDRLDLLGVLKARE
jgi:putative ABC transport system permease protein